MAVTWLATIPGPLASSVQITRQKERSRLEFDGGNSRSIKRASTAPYNMQCSFIMSAAQYAIFDHFYKFDLNMGIDWITSGWIEALFPSHYCRFLEMPKVSKSGPRFIVQALLEVQRTDSIIYFSATDWPVSNLTPPLFPIYDKLEFYYDASVITETIGKSYGTLPNMYGSGNMIFSVTGNGTPPTVSVQETNGYKGVFFPYSYNGYATLYNSNYNTLPILTSDYFTALIVFSSATYFSCGMATHAASNKVFEKQSNSAVRIYNYNSQFDEYSFSHSNQRNCYLAEIPPRLAGYFTKLWINNSYIGSKASYGSGNNIISFGEPYLNNYIHEIHVWKNKTLTDQEKSIAMTAMLNKWNIA